MNTSDTLNKAADLIEERGWTAGSGWLHSDTAHLCLEGGIQAAMGFDISSPSATGRIGIDEDKYAAFCGCPAYAAVRSYLERPGPFAYLYDWNDDHGRTVSEVVEVLRACAVIEASRERQSVSA